MQTNDLFLQRSRDNDEFARVVVGRNRSDQGAELVISKWRSCEHLFVKIRKSKYIGAFHSSDCETIPARYECVKCGLTNRLIDMEDLLYMHDSGDSILPDKKKVSDETTEWTRQKPEISDKTLLSRSPIRTSHPGILFEAAVELCFAQGIKATKQNIFKVMEELSSMETTTEKLKISTTVHASALIERYKNEHKLYVSEDL